MTSITMSKRHRQPVTDDDMSRQSNVFTPDNGLDMERPSRKPVMTLHLPHRREAAVSTPQEPTQLSLLDTDPGT
ncbi:hypothetical protein AEP_00748 [Curvibacter sp. AEP1-3]|jgi:hypothetical protein|uniref:hypothetical protein n=1 Tax=Curvibacter sp. AEP1-3 TaxID=1844971 RepID=UPI000B3CFACA|nr:hypothetical protein [Curvibacter sp. AEP1-3]ARV17707.1 hypothetical protein AEP_00748 [Curvibacter sp. AEP1-3]